MRSIVRSVSISFALQIWRLQKISQWFRVDIVGLETSQEVLIMGAVERSA